MTEVLIGIISGIVSGTGMGGGTILIFLLTFLCNVEQHIAQATNLIFFIFRFHMFPPYLFDLYIISYFDNFCTFYLRKCHFSL